MMEFGLADTHKAGQRSIETSPYNYLTGAIEQGTACVANAGALEPATR